MVTGASSGIGLETARSLARAGAEVTLAVRNTGAGLAAARDIAQSAGRDGAHVAALDLADRAAVAGFVQDWTGPLHLLINNAAVITPALARTAEGWELQFATSYLGHFALSLGLRNALAAGARYKTAGQGAATTLLAAVAPELAHTGGHYLDDGREAYTVPNDAELFENSHGVKQWAVDPDVAQKLWTVSLDLTGQSSPPSPGAP